MYGKLREGTIPPRKPIHKFRSNFEAKFADDLTKRGKKYEYETEKLKYVLRRNYIPDFIIRTASGRKLYIETKGRFTSEDRAKFLAVLRDNPDCDVRIIFQRSSQRLSKVSRTTYGQWADWKKIKWAQGTIPQEWLEE